jgi:hypothetical protein
LPLGLTHLAFEHDTFLVPFSEQSHVIRCHDDVRHAVSNRASRVRLRLEHSG